MPGGGPDTRNDTQKNIFKNMLNIKNGKGIPLDSKLKQK
jgi:hypothetical protein